jgi:hypothetical protein
MNTNVRTAVRTPMTIRPFNCKTGAALWLMICIGSVNTTIAQEKNEQPAVPQSSCSRENAIEIIQQQLAAARIFENEVQKVTVLIRGAELLWPLRQEKARAGFSDAFETAVHNFKERGDAPDHDGKLAIGVPDQRYSVISAIAKRDAVWARKLTDQLLKEQEQETKDKPTKDNKTEVAAAEKLLTVASSMLPSEPGTAVGFARSSLRYPATMYLTPVLYRLATIDQSAANQFYQEALAAYAGAPMERLLYLSAYPFGNHRDAGDMPGYMYYTVPEGFKPNPILQRAFVQTILSRAQEFINNPTETPAGHRISEPGQMLLAFTRLAAQIQQSLPDLAPAVEAVKGNLLARTPESTQRDVSDKISDDNPPVRSFEEQLEEALKNPNVDRRDWQLTSAITGAPNSVSLDVLLSTVDKIADSNVRQPLLNWLFFERATGALKDAKLDEARKLAARVGELDQRVYLDARIAEELLKQNPDQTAARDVLEEVVAVAAKAPSTPVTARALMAVAYLYSKFDVNRAVAVMAEAVKCINRIDKPDFSRQFIMRKIEGKAFGTYTSAPAPGFNPENAFREIAKTDFDGMLNLASNFTDKSLRATTAFAVVETCLQQLSKAEKAAPKGKVVPAKPY